MAKLKDQLTSEVAGIILRYVRNRKGRLTELSNDCRINRREFNVRGLSKMKLHRLLRLMYGLCMELSYEDFVKMNNEIRDTIVNYVDDYDYALLDE